MKTMKLILENWRKVNETFRLESDFSVGDMVTWNSLDRVEKVTDAGRVKIDFDRVMHTGEIIELPSTGGALGEPGVAIIRSEDGSSQEMSVSELTAV